MKKFDWKKYIYKIVVVVLIVFFVGGVGIGAANILSIEGTRELYTPQDPLTVFPQTDGQVVSYVDGTVEKALGTMPKVDMWASCSVDEGSFENSADNARINAAAVMAVSEYESAVEASFESKTAEFDKSAASFLKVTGISEDDVTGTEINYEYYTCTLCTSSIALEDYAEECPECGGENTLELRSGDVYEIIINVNPASASFENTAFPKGEAEESILAENGKGYYTLKFYKRDVTAAKVVVRVNRLTDKLESVRYETDSDITAVLSFEGKYASLGEVTLSFKQADECNYGFTWAGISLDTHEKIVELGSSEVLKATLSCDDPVAYTVDWSSSDESVLTVDEEGYLKTHKKLGDATITAKYEFNGKEYSDSCLIHVGVPAEGVDLSKGKLKLAAGESYQLVAEFDPKDTTNTVCYWFTEDETVAVIDGEGKVTAVSEGTVIVYVVTDDGNYYSSCEVEVTA